MKNSKPIRIVEKASEATTALEAMSADAISRFSSFQDLTNFLATFAEKVEVEACESKPTDITDEFAKVFNQIAEDPVVKHVVESCKSFFSDVVKKGLKRQ